MERVLEIEREGAGGMKRGDQSADTIPETAEGSAEVPAADSRVPEDSEGTRALRETGAPPISEGASTQTVALTPEEEELCHLLSASFHHNIKSGPSEAVDKDTLLPLLSSYCDLSHNAFSDPEMFSPAALEMNTALSAHFSRLLNLYPRNFEDSNTTEPREVVRRLHKEGFNLNSLETCFDFTGSLSWVFDLPEDVPGAGSKAAAEEESPAGVHSVCILACRTLGAVLVALPGSTAEARGAEKRAGGSSDSPSSRGSPGSPVPSGFPTFPSFPPPVTALLNLNYGYQGITSQEAWAAASLNDLGLGSGQLDQEERETGLETNDWYQGPRQLSSVAYCGMGVLALGFYDGTLRWYSLDIGAGVGIRADVSGGQPSPGGDAPAVADTSNRATPDAVPPPADSYRPLDPIASKDYVGLGPVLGLTHSPLPPSSAFYDAHAGMASLLVASFAEGLYFLPGQGILADEEALASAKGDSALLQPEQEKRLSQDPSEGRYDGGYTDMGSREAVLSAARPYLVASTAASPVVCGINLRRAQAFGIARMKIFSDLAASKLSEPAKGLIRSSLRHLRDFLSSRLPSDVVDTTLSPFHSMALSPWAYSQPVGPLVGGQTSCYVNRRTVASLYFPGRRETCGGVVAYFGTLDTGRIYARLGESVAYRGCLYPLALTDTAWYAPDPVTALTAMQAPYLVISGHVSGYLRVFYAKEDLSLVLTSRIRLSAHPIVALAGSPDCSFLVAADAAGVLHFLAGPAGDFLVLGSFDLRKVATGVPTGESGASGVSESDPARQRTGPRTGTGIQPIPHSTAGSLISREPVLDTDFTGYFVASTLLTREQSASEEGVLTVSSLDRAGACGAGDDELQGSSGQGVTELEPPPISFLTTHTPSSDSSSAAYKGAASIQELIKPAFRPQDPRDLCGADFSGDLSAGTHVGQISGAAASLELRPPQEQSKLALSKLKTRLSQVSASVAPSYSPFQDPYLPLLFNIVTALDATTEFVYAACCNGDVVRLSRPPSGSLNTRAEHASLIAAGDFSDSLQSFSDKELEGTISKYERVASEYSWFSTQQLRATVLHTGEVIQAIAVDPMAIPPPCATGDLVYCGLEDGRVCAYFSTTDSPQSGAQGAESGDRVSRPSADWEGGDAASDAPPEASPADDAHGGTQGGISGSNPGGNPGGNPDAGSEGEQDSPPAGSLLATPLATVATLPASLVSLRISPDQGLLLASDTAGNVCTFTAALPSQIFLKRAIASVRDYGRVEQLLSPGPEDLEGAGGCSYLQTNIARPTFLSLCTNSVVSAQGAGQEVHNCLVASSAVGESFSANLPPGVAAASLRAIQAIDSTVNQFVQSFMEASTASSGGSAVALAAKAFQAVMEQRKRVRYPLMAQRDASRVLRACEQSLGLRDGPLAADDCPNGPLYSHAPYFCSTELLDILRGATSRATLQYLNFNECKDGAYVPADALKTVQAAVDATCARISMSQAPCGLELPWGQAARQITRALSARLKLHQVARVLEDAQKLREACRELEAGNIRTLGQRGLDVVYKDAGLASLVGTLRRKRESMREAVPQGRTGAVLSGFHITESMVTLSGLSQSESGPELAGSAEGEPQKGFDGPATTVSQAVLQETVDKPPAEYDSESEGDEEVIDVASTLASCPRVPENALRISEQASGTARALLLQAMAGAEQDARRDVLTLKALVDSLERQTLGSNEPGTSGEAVAGMEDKPTHVPGFSIPRQANNVMRKAKKVLLLRTAQITSQRYAHYAPRAVYTRSHEDEETDIVNQSLFGGNGQPSGSQSIYSALVGGEEVARVLDADVSVSTALALRYDPDGTMRGVVGGASVRQSSSQVQPAGPAQGVSQASTADPFALGSPTALPPAAKGSLFSVLNLGSSTAQCAPLIPYARRPGAKDGLGASFSLLPDPDILASQGPVGLRRGMFTEAEAVFSIRARQQAIMLLAMCILLMRSFNSIHAAERDVKYRTSGRISELAQQLKDSAKELAYIAKEETLTGMIERKRAQLYRDAIDAGASPEDAASRAAKGAVGQLPSEDEIAQTAMKLLDLDLLDVHTIVGYSESGHPEPCESLESLLGYNPYVSGCSYGGDKSLGGQKPGGHVETPMETLVSELRRLASQGTIERLSVTVSQFMDVISSGQLKSVSENRMLHTALLALTDEGLFDVQHLETLVRTMRARERNKNAITDKAVLRLAAAYRKALYDMMRGSLDAASKQTVRDIVIPTCYGLQDVPGIKLTKDQVQEIELYKARLTDLAERRGKERRSLEAICRNVREQAAELSRSFDNDRLRNLAARRFGAELKLQGLQLAANSCNARALDRAGTMQEQAQRSQALARLQDFSRATSAAKVIGEEIVRRLQKRVALLRGLEKAFAAGLKRVFQDPAVQKFLRQRTNAARTRQVIRDALAGQRIEDIMYGHAGSLHSGEPAPLSTIQSVIGSVMGNSSAVVLQQVQGQTQVQGAAHEPGQAQPQDSASLYSAALVTAAAIGFQGFAPSSPDQGSALGSVLGSVLGSAPGNTLGNTPNSNVASAASLAEAPSSSKGTAQERELMAHIDSISPLLGDIEQSQSGSAMAGITDSTAAAISTAISASRERFLSSTGTALPPWADLPQDPSLPESQQASSSALGRNASSGRLEGMDRQAGRFAFSSPAFTGASPARCALILALPATENALLIRLAMRLFPLSQAAGIQQLQAEAQFSGPELQNLNILRCTKLVLDMQLQEALEMLTAAQGHADIASAASERAAARTDTAHMASLQETRRANAEFIDAPIVVLLSEGQVEPSRAWDFALDDNRVVFKGEILGCPEGRGFEGMGAEAAGPVDEVIADTSQYVLLPKEYVEQANARLQELGEKRLAALRALAAFRQRIRTVEHQIRLLDWKKRDTQAQTRDVQLIRISREMLELLNEKGSVMDKRSRELAAAQRKLDHTRKSHALAEAQTDALIGSLPSELAAVEKQNEMLLARIKELTAHNAQRKMAIPDSELETEKKDTTAEAEKQFRRIAALRKMKELSRAQEDELEFLMTELEKLRRRTYPSFD